jgi:uncharacterized delta-60 repeat protein
VKVLMGRAASAVGVAVAALGVAGLALALPGDLDMTFNGSGFVVTSINAVPPIYDQASAVARQTNGFLVVGGLTTVGAAPYTGSDFALARFTAAGSLDPSFGVAGKVTTAFGPAPTPTGAGGGIAAVVIQPNGRIVAAGTYSDTNTSTTDFALARYLPNGSLDGSFGGGKVRTAFGPASEATARALLRQPDGKLVAAGWSRTAAGVARFALARYLPNGSLDASFGNGGKVTTMGVGRAAALVRQPNGRLVLAGGTQIRFTLARYLPNGSLDPNFGTGGKVTTPSVGSATALVRQPDGKLVAAGGSDSHFMLVRYLSNGSLDSSFGSGGTVTTPGVGGAAALARQQNGKLVVAGTDGQRHFTLVRYLPSGSLDTTFGSAGVVSIPLGPGGLYSDHAAALLVQPNGMLVAAGWSQQDSGRTAPNYVVDMDFAVARFLP